MDSLETAETATENRWTFGRVVRAMLGVELIVLLALAQVIFAGYRMGVGNQSIQIPFLKHAADPTLFANDPMVKQTLGDYHSYFFKILAAVVGERDLDAAYFWLHVITSAAVLGAAYGLGRAIFRSRASAAILVLLMLAGHHRALAGDDLYSPGFTHTWAVFPLAIWAMTLFYKERRWGAFALVGVIFNLHALTAGYLIAMFLAAVVLEFVMPGRGAVRRGALPLLGMLALFAVIASPTLFEMLADRQKFGPEWLAATRVRSADHSFPKTWWTAGATDVPRFVLLLGIAAVSLSFAAPRGNQRKSLTMALGVGGLFVLGYLLAEVWPVATVIRAQPFRASRLLMVLVLAHIANGIAQGLGFAPGRRWRWPWAPRPGVYRDWRGSTTEPPAAGRPVSVSDSGSIAALVGRRLEVALAVLTFICVAVPGLMAFAPWVLVSAVWAATLSGRLSWGQALAGSLALFVALIAWTTIDYHIPGLDAEFSMDGLTSRLAEAGNALWVAVGVAAVVFAIRLAPVGPRAKLCAAAMIFYACALLGLYGRMTFADTVADSQRQWVAAQVWAAKNTPRDALFLTPPQQGGFRIYSDRSVVCEWRDGTQLYFSAGFAKDWWDKLTTLRPVLYDKSGTREITAGKTLEKMGDREIVELAKAYGANYVVLPTNKERPRELNLKYENAAWAVYDPRILDEQDRFIENVALPNIEKYRKSDVRIELRDASGQTITNGQYTVNQTRQAFGFGVSLPFFATPAGDSANDNFEPPVITPKQMQRVKDVFNYSVIPFSAKWQRIEPVEGERHYEDLDKYVDWCVANGIAIEFHYLSGFSPRWLRFKTADDQRLAWVRHCRETVERYHDRIKFWQVVNDERLLSWSVEVFKEIRAKYPDLKLGVSNCSTFYSPDDSRMSPAMEVGMEEIETLKESGIKLDFYSTHGHKPMGVWPDARVMYDCFDAFAAKGVKMHISEATLDTGMRVISKVRSETAWTPELAAEFYERFYTVAFSHPAVEAVNYWDLAASLDRYSAARGINGGGGGPVGPIQGGMSLNGTGKAGMLEVDDDATPRPLYTRLKALIQGKWMTRTAGRVGGDGAVAFRGFHGEYEIAVRTPAGKELRGRFTVTPDGANAMQLKLTDAAATPSIAVGK